MEENTEFNSLEEFWPFYLNEHSKETNRTFHFVGSSLGLYWLFKAIYKRNPKLLLVGLFMGYACAWFGHFFIEKNKPATFKYPLKSFISDWKMFYFTLTGKIDQEIERVNSDFV